jgi:hypothetical protein|tara:strand:+ start:359 stop:562 length:204 start_codon:yes stop_codon:yes gene_type:complete
MQEWLIKEASKKYFAAHGLYYVDDIIEAIDIAIGDDGFRSKEVIEILKADVGEDKRVYVGEHKNEHS